jgi:transcriptional regulator with XRE-family HTH domain
MEHDKNLKAVPTSRRYASVADLMKGEEISEEIQRKVSDLAKETRIADCLVLMRLDAGLTQADMAKTMGLSQSAISKLEAKADDEITMGEIRAYAKSTNQRIAIHFGKPMNHVEAVKHHAFCIKERLESLAEIAQKYEEIQGEIKGFFGEAFFNILDILAKCQKQLPNTGDFEVRFHVIENHKSRSKHLPNRDEANSSFDVKSETKENEATTPRSV